MMTPISELSSSSTSSSTRLAEAIHSATRTELSMNQLKAICAEMKAAVSCMTIPSVRAPERYLGATSTKRNQRHQRAISALHGGDHPIAMDLAYPGGDDASIVLQNRTQFVGVAANKRDAFRILLQPCEFGEEPRFSLVLLRNGRNERTSGEVGEAAGDRRIDHRGEAEISRQHEARAEQIKLQGAANVPQNSDEGQRRRQRGQKADGEFDQRIDGELHILGNSVFRRGLLGCGDLKTVVALVLKPPAQDLSVSHSRQRICNVMRATSVPLMARPLNATRAGNRIVAELSASTCLLSSASKNVRFHFVDA